jgi:hypothetical protein
MPTLPSSLPGSRSAVRHRRHRHRAWIGAVSFLIATAFGLAILLVFSSGMAENSATSVQASGRHEPMRSAKTGVSATAPSRASVRQPPTQTPATAGAPMSTPFNSQTLSYLASRQDNVTAAVFDVATSQEWTYHPGFAQDTASIVKVDVMATLMTEETAAQQTLSTADQALLSSMVEVSDNGAATTLWGTVGGPTAVDAFNGSIGMTGTTASTCLQCAGFQWPGWGLTTTTAVDQITLLRTVLFPSALITADDRTVAVDPSGVTVALKNGWVPLANSLWQINSIGWINGGGRDYLIAVLTDGNPTEQYGIDTIDALSADVWNAMGPSGGG